MEKIIDSIKLRLKDFNIIVTDDFVETDSNIITTEMEALNKNYIIKVYFKY